MVKLGKCRDNGGLRDFHVKVGSFKPDAYVLSALRSSGESSTVAEQGQGLKPPRSLWARRFSAARMIAPFTFITSSADFQFPHCILKRSML